MAACQHPCRNFDLTIPKHVFRFAHFQFMLPSLKIALKRDPRQVFKQTTRTTNTYTHIHAQSLHTRTHMHPRTHTYTTHWKVFTAVVKQLEGLRNMRSMGNIESTRCLVQVPAHALIPSRPPVYFTTLTHSQSTRHPTQAQLQLLRHFIIVCPTTDVHWLEDIVKILAR